MEQPWMQLLRGKGGIQPVDSTLTPVDLPAGDPGVASGMVESSINPLDYRIRSLLNPQANPMSGINNVYRQMEDAMGQPVQVASGLPDKNQLLQLGLLALVGGVLDKKGGFSKGVIQGGLSAAERKAETENKNKVMERQDKLQMLGLQLEKEKMKANMEQDKREKEFQLAVRDKEIQQKLITDRENTLKGLRATFNQSNDPGEAEWSARQLEGTPYAVTPAELTAKVQSMARLEVQNYMSNMTRMLNAAVISPEDRQQMLFHRDDIIKRYHLDPNAIPMPPTSESLRKLAMDRQQAQFKDKMALANKKFADDAQQHAWMRNVKFPKDLAVKWAMVQVARENAVTSAANSSIYGQRFAQEQLQGTSTGLGRDYQKKIDAVTAELNGVNGILQNRYVNKTPSMKDLNNDKDYQKSVALQNELHYWQSQMEDLNLARNEAFLPSFEPGDLRGDLGGSMFGLQPDRSPDNKQYPSQALGTGMIPVSPRVSPPVNRTPPKATPKATPKAPAKGKPKFNSGNWETTVR